LAAVELKKAGWLFNKRHETWFNGLNNMSISSNEVSQTPFYFNNKTTDY
jgi:CCR4-NOT transcriptional regulation complex NOT5 subunit